MKLYHVSDRIIKAPDIHAGRSNADFGPGFYLSTDEEFSGNWAREKANTDIYVNVYDLDTDGLAVKTLSRNIEWFKIIYNNRLSRGDGLSDCDVAIGPVAADTLFDTLGIATSGLIEDEIALAIISIGHEYTQVAVKSDKALSKLKWADAFTISDESLRQARARYDASNKSFEKEFVKLLGE